MPNKVFQGIINQMGETISREIGVIDDNGVAIACSNLGRVGYEITVDAAEVMSSSQLVHENGYTFKRVNIRDNTWVAVFVQGEDSTAEGYAGLVGVSLSYFRHMYEEQYDAHNFVKNLILDNIMPGDIYAKSKDIGFAGDIPRVAYFIQLKDTYDVAPFDIIRNMFPDHDHDFVINIDEQKIAVIKELGKFNSRDDVEKIAHEILDMLSTEYFVKCVIGIGTVSGSISEISTSFKEARMALEVGKVFDIEKSIVSYDNLGIARLIYQLPTTLCEMFLNEVFKKESIDAIDQETLNTIQEFFANNLNISETSRKLFIHRNTLVYRLDRVKRMTGLDLRGFDHAIVFKVALMVKKYLDSDVADR